MYIGLAIGLAVYWTIRVFTKVLNRRYYLDVFFILVIVLGSLTAAGSSLITPDTPNIPIAIISVLVAIYHSILVYMKLAMVDNRYRWIHHHNRAVVNYDIPHEKFSTRAADGVSISGIHIPNENANPKQAIIVCHGASRTKYSAPIVQTCMILSTRYNVFSFDFRGHMDSTGTFFLNGEEIDQDLSAVIDYARSKGFDEIAIVGWSIGGAATIRCAASGQPIKAFVAGAPAIEIPEAAELHLLRNPITRYIIKPAFLVTRQLKVSIHKGQQNTPTTLEIAQNLPDIPMLLVYNEYDYVLRIGAEKFEEYFETFPASKQLLRLSGRGHLFDWPNNFFFWRTLMDWLGENFD